MQKMCYYKTHNLSLIQNIFLKKKKKKKKMENLLQHNFGKIGIIAIHTFDIIEIDRLMSNFIS